METENQHNQNEDKDNQMTSVDLDQPLKKEMVGTFIQKSDLVGTKRDVTVKNLAKNQFGRWMIDAEVEGYEEVMSINLNKTNFNQLIDILGNVPKEWIGKSVKVSGQRKTFDIKGEGPVEGVTLTFSAE